MTRSNHLTQIIACLLIIVATGCAQQSSTHVVIYEAPVPDVSETFNAKTPQSTPAPSAESTENAFIAALKANPFKKITQQAPESIWTRLLSLYTLTEIDHKRIEPQLNWYIQHPDYITRIQKRAEPYLYYILDQIEEKNIPGELALLPAVESAFRPNAYSRSHASGLWQFIPATGRFFDLKQNWWYDGRRDVVASTQAATLYLKQLNEEFEGDWPLALASYNAGKGNIKKAIRRNQKRNKGSDYWSLDLTQETMDYVPRLLAIAKIFANPDQYNITLQPIPNRPYFDIVDIQAQLDLSKAAEMAQMPIDEFLNLNPGFNRWSTDPDGPHRLLIPSDKADEFNYRLSQLPKHERMKWVRHKIKSGENLSVIAQKHRVTVQALKQSNRLTSNRIRAGKHLLIPASMYAQSHASLSGHNQNQVYKVKKGDSFWKIAQLFSVSTKDIARWNQLSLNTALQPGQRLQIKSSGKISASSSSINPLQPL